MLFIFVEGFYDKKYFEHVYCGIFACQPYKYIEYANLSTGVINKLIHTIITSNYDNYLFFADSDGKNIDAKKTDLRTHYPELSPERTIVTQYEIESWYFAGASEKTCQQLRIKHYQFHTDDLSKEEFYYKLPSRVERIVIMNSILELYSIQLAICRNRSLNHFNAIVSRLIN